MTLRSAEFSSDTVENVRARLSELVGRDGFRNRALAQANPLAIGLAAAHDVYSLGLDQVARGDGIDVAERVAQRFLVMDGERAIASEEVVGSDESGFESNEGPFVAATAAAIDYAERDPQLADGAYELRVLRIPALYLMALWLKDENGRGDVLIPMSPAPPPLEPLRAYAPDELLAELREQAETRLRQDV